MAIEMPQLREMPRGAVPGCALYPAAAGADTDTRLVVRVATTTFRWCRGDPRESPRDRLRSAILIGAWDRSGRLIVHRQGHARRALRSGSE
jgi:hypothetical protein